MPGSTPTAWVAILAIPVAVAQARAAVGDETGRTLALARAAASAALPTAFCDRDMLAGGARARIARGLHDRIGPVPFALGAALAQPGVLAGGSAPLRLPGPGGERASGPAAAAPGGTGATAAAAGSSASAPCPGVGPGVRRILKDRPGATRRADPIARGRRQLRNPPGGAPGAGG